MSTQTFICYDCSGKLSENLKGAIEIYLPANGTYSIVNIYNVSDLDGNKILVHLHAGSVLLTDPKDNKERFAIDLNNTIDAPSAETIDSKQDVEVSVWHEELLTSSDTTWIAGIAQQRFNEIQKGDYCGKSRTLDGRMTEPNGCGMGGLGQ